MSVPTAIGHAAVAATALALINTILRSADTFSTVNPFGTKEEEWRLRFMLLIPLANRSDINSQHHQM